MSELTQQVEAILFVASAPVPLTRLAEATDASTDHIEEALTELEQALSSTGLRLSRHRLGLRLVTAPAASVQVQRFLQQEAKTELSKPALETLSIIAYRGPLGRTEIEAIRGVGSEATLRNLLGRGLIQTQGTAPGPGRPPLYHVSPEFLDLFGLSHTGELPDLESSETPDAA